MSGDQFKVFHLAMNLSFLYLKEVNVEKLSERDNFASVIIHGLSG